MEDVYKRQVVLNALALLFAAGAMAQDCTFFFPQTKGTQLVKKGYDAKGNLQSVICLLYTSRCV